MSTPGTPAPYFRYWGKAKPRDDTGARNHLLPYHCLDVAAVAAEWWQSSAVIRAGLMSSLSQVQSENQVRAWMLFFVVAHDYGKFDLRFQAKAPDVLQKRGYPLPSKRSVSDYYHGEEGFFHAMRADLKQHLKFDHERLDAWKPWLAAVTGHHGELPQGGGHTPPNTIWANEDRAARLEWLRALADLFLAPVGLSLQDAPPAFRCVFTFRVGNEPVQEQVFWLAGFCSICDWIGSMQTLSEPDGTTRSLFDYCTDVSEGLPAYFERRRALVRETDLLARVGLSSVVAAYKGAQALLAANMAPRQVQTLVDKLPVAPGLTVIEAPTGCGKTEAALAYAWRLLDAGLAESIVFALPTQATANAMLKRLEKVANVLFAKAGPNLLLAHAKRDYNPIFISLREAARAKPRQGKVEALAQAVEWLSQSRKRVFLGQIGVCTVDQVLLSVLPVRHKFVRALGVMKSVLIVDEVHAYDRYMTGLLEAVLQQQHSVGGSVVLLSATLSSPQLRDLQNAWNAAPMPIAERRLYPLVTWIGNATVLPLQPDDHHLPEPRQVWTELLTAPEARADEALFERMITAARQGARVVLICNRVDMAQDAYAAVCALAGDTPVDLFHSRYRFLDRQKRERQVTVRYKPRKCRGRGRILVATQVVEQSLDLDFDWLITQLCPADLLFQRMGRLHRHLLPRLTGYERPRCTVLLPLDARYEPFSTIYGNVRALWRTECLLRSESGKAIQFPAAFRDWIEDCYAEEWQGPAEPLHIQNGYDKFHIQQSVSRSQAHQFVTQSTQAYNDDSAHLNVFTRDGEMSRMVVLLQADGKLLGGDGLAGLDDGARRERLDMNSIPVPHKWDCVLPAANPDDDMHYLTLHPRANGSWRGQHQDTAFTYDVEIGLQRSALVDQKKETKGRVK